MNYGERLAKVPAMNAPLFLPSTGFQAAVPKTTGG
jgi:hypothetical protein